MKKNLLILVAVFVLGIIAGLGFGTAIGKLNAEASLVQSNNELQTRIDTINENYMIMMREYNKLFSSQARFYGNPVTPQVDPAANSSVVILPQSPNTETTTSTEKAPVVESTKAPAAGATIVADFAAVAIEGTGLLEGPPPQQFQFTDKSTGNITSWEWNFGDGNTSTEQNPNHTIEYCPMGDMCTVTLTVCGPEGCDTETKIDYLLVSESCTGC